MDEHLIALMAALEPFAFTKEGMFGRGGFGTNPKIRRWRRCVLDLGLLVWVLFIVALLVFALLVFGLLVVLSCIAQHHLQASRFTTR